VEGQQPKAVSPRQQPQEVRDEIDRRKEVEKALRNDRQEHVPQAVRDYLEVVRTAKRLQKTNPTLADSWREKAYIYLNDLLEVRE
jgi:hypothetical protein